MEDISTKIESAQKLTKSGNKPRPACYSDMCDCGRPKNRRAQRCRKCQITQDKTIRRQGTGEIFIYNDQACCHIPLTKGQVAIVSAEDYPALSLDNWCAWYNNDTASYYAKRAVKFLGRYYVLMMHNVVFGPVPALKLVDHKNKTSLDNTRGNLREVDKNQNMFNSGKRRNNTSGYKGVTWSNQKNKWQAQIKARGIYKNLGFYVNPAEAHEAYKRAALVMHDEYARFE